MNQELEQIAIQLEIIVDQETIDVVKLHSVLKQLIQVLSFLRVKE